MIIDHEIASGDFNEYYGPIDGVRPEDYTDTNYTYLAIMYSVCLKAIDNEEIYVRDNRRNNRMCGHCYTTYRPPNYIKVESGHLVRHRRNFNPNTKLYCEKCFKQILRENTSANNCQECIEEIIEAGLRNFMTNELVVTKRY